MLLQATCPRSLLTSGVPSTWADCYSSHFARSTGTATVSHQQLQWHFTALSIMNTLKNRVSSATSPLHTDSALQLLLQHHHCTLILHCNYFCNTSYAHWSCTTTNSASLALHTESALSLSQWTALSYSHRVPRYFCDLGHAQALSYLEGLPKVNRVPIALSTGAWQERSTRPPQRSALTWLRKL